MKYKYKRPEKKYPPLKSCRVCGEPLRRTGEPGHPSHYCNQDHKRIWRKAYRCIWNKKTIKERR